MILYYSDLKVAAGHDNAAGLASIETVLGISGVFPYVIGTYSPGIRKITGGGRLFIAGKPSCAWHFVVIPQWSKHKTLMTTFCNGGYGGEVTVRTRTDDSASYANYNAMLGLPFLTETTALLGHLEDYVMTFTRMVAI